MSWLILHKEEERHKKWWQIDVMVWNIWILTSVNITITHLVDIYIA